MPPPDTHSGNKNPADDKESNVTGDTEDDKPRTAPATFPDSITPPNIAQPEALPNSEPSISGTTSIASLHTQGPVTDTPSLPVPQLSAAMYPHLIDLIFAHASNEALLYLRATSRGWRERSDSVLARHLVFARGVVSARDTDGSLMRYPPCCPSSTFTMACQIPGPSVVDLLDSHGSYYSYIMAFDCPPVLTRVWENHKVKCCPGCARDDQYCLLPWPPNTVVLFGQTSPTVFHISPFDDIGGEADKLVLNISATARRWHYFDLGIRGYKPEEIGINIVFNFVAGLPDRDGCGISKFFWEALAHSAKYPQIRLTFVNTAAVPPDFMISPPAFEGSLPATDFPSLQKPRPPQECAIAFLDVLRAMDKPRLPVIEFLTSAEYEARVGTRTYRWETMEKP